MHEDVDRTNGAATLASSEDFRAGIVRGCHHARAHHEHGSRLAYASDGCRCTACRAANTATARTQRRAIAYGACNCLIPADTARQHLRNLSRAGIGVPQVATLTGISRSTLRQLTEGVPSCGVPPTRYVHRATATRILAVHATDTNLADGARIDATGTRRRLQALIAIGWTISALAPELDRDSSNLRRTLHRDVVTVRTAHAVGELFWKLADAPPELSSQAQRGAAERARAYARQRGWQPPLAWDNIDTDPEPSSDAVDYTSDEIEVDDLDVEIAIDRVLARRPVTLTSGELDEVVHRLTERGHSLHQIAELLGVSSRTISRRRRAVRVA